MKRPEWPLTPEPRRPFSFIDGFRCVYCKEKTRLQLIRDTWELRCATCGSKWNTVSDYADLYVEVFGDDDGAVPQIEKVVAASRTASGG